MNRPVCVLCEGARDVSNRNIAGVPLAVCRWCWRRFGPAHWAALTDYDAAELADPDELADLEPSC